MAVTSIRLNEKEEKVLNYLKKYFNCDSSTLLKRSLYELYEDLKDKEIIDTFENDLKNSNQNFVKYEDLFKS
jgi:hypothetical protein